MVNLGLSHCIPILSFFISFAINIAFVIDNYKLIAYNFHIYFPLTKISCPITLEVLVEVFIWGFL